MKLLICDDDISTIDVIQSQLDCQELGITNILRAYNGEAAKEVILREKPELILCDIGMPKVNGVEVLKFIDENKIHTEFAFLTCFDDFEYARSAVRYGASNYLTKPVDFQELDEALHRMADAARAYQEQQRQRENGSQDDAAFNNLLRQMLMGFFGADRNRAEEALRRNGVSDLRADTPVRLVMIYADLTEAAQDGVTREKLACGFGPEAERALTDYAGLRSTVVDLSERYLSSVTVVRADCLTEAECVARAEALVRRCGQEYALSPVVLIGEEGPFAAIGEACASLRTQIRRVLLRAGHVFLRRDAEKLPGADQAVTDTEKMLRMIRLRDRDGFLALVKDALNRIAFSQKDNGSLMAMLHREITAGISDLMRDNGLSVRELFRNERFRNLDLYAERSPADMREFAAHLYDAVLAELEFSADAASLVDAVKHYIRQNYREDLTRNDLADVVHITPNYLSKRFHSETGMSLREYINRLRVDEAKRLLLSTNATISEIASEVGFDNISYFSTVFRKQCGVSPIEWSRGAGSEEETSRCE